MNTIVPHKPEKCYNPDRREFPANALIVTSRKKEKFKEIDINIETLRFDGGKLAYFIEQYLKLDKEKLDKKKLDKDIWDLFKADQEEFLQECAQLARIVGEQKTITVLLAKLYAERMINAKQDYSLAFGRSLDNIPDLILAHLKKLNEQGEINTKIEKPDVIDVIEDAKVIAWKCLEQNYKSSSVDLEAVVTALGRGEEKAELCLEYFEKHLRLLKLKGYGEERKDRDKIRFALDPLAEYLAALYLVQDHCKDDGEKWRTFLAEVEKKSGNLEEIKGFLLAIRDCCLTKGSEARVPSFVADELGKLAGLDLEALEQERQQQRIKRLLRNLFAPEATVEDRVDDLKKIGESGSVAKFAAPTIVQFLTHNHSYVRQAAASALGNLGNASEPVVQSLLTLLHNDNSGVRKAAAEALGKLGNASEFVVQGLLVLLQDHNSDVRMVAASALGKLGNTSESLVQGLLVLLQDHDSDVRMVAVYELINLGNASESLVQGLLVLLQDHDSDVRSSAAFVLGHLGNASESLVQGLLVLLQDHDSDVRMVAASALGHLGNASESVVQGLLVLLQDHDSDVRMVAASALGKLGNASEPLIQGLLVLIKDSSSYPKVGSSAAEAMVKLGKASELLKELLALFKDGDVFGISLAIEAFGKLGNASQFLEERLLKLLKDKDEDFYDFYAPFLTEVLGHLGNASQSLEEGLLALVKDDDPYVCLAAARALIKLGKASEPVEKSLLDLLHQYDDSEVRSSCAELLGDLGNASEPVVQGLSALVEDDDSYVRWVATEALAQLGYPSEPVN